MPDIGTLLKMLFQYWSDKKHAVRRKAAKNQTGKPSEYVELSEVENRIFAMLQSLQVSKTPVTLRQLPEPSKNNDQSMIVVVPLETNVSSTQENQHNDEPRTVEDNVEPDVSETTTVQAMEPFNQSPINKCTQTTTVNVSVPTLKGVMKPIILRRLLVKPRIVPQSDASPVNRPKMIERPRVRNSNRGRRRITQTPTMSKRRQTQFTQIANRFLRVEEQRLENDKRTTNILETITRVVNRVLERDAENSRMMSQAMLSVGEGLKLLAEAVKIEYESE